MNIYISICPEGTFPTQIRVTVFPHEWLDGIFTVLYFDTMARCIDFIKIVNPAHIRMSQWMSEQSNS